MAGEFTRWENYSDDFSFARHFVAGDMPRQGRGMSFSKRAKAGVLLVRETGCGGSEEAKYLGRDPANVSAMLSRLSARQ